MNNTAPAKIPVTILTGFLGSGKTTLLNRVLQEQHGHKIAVIENEFGQEGIDNEILMQQTEEQIIVMNNGCICCTVRDDLIQILHKLTEQRDTGQLEFERVIIETTGLADPAPVAQTFFMDKQVARRYRLDAILTVVDALHAQTQLDEHHEVQVQVALADRLLISKTDLVTAQQADKLSARLARLNPRAAQKQVHFGQTEIAEILDIRGFKLDDVLEINPDFLTQHAHGHTDAVYSFVYRDDNPLDQDKLKAFFAEMVKTYGVDMLRYKGILNIQGEANRMIFQGVHMLFASGKGKPWNIGEPRESVMVFIGRNLPEQRFHDGLAACRADVGSDATSDGM